MKKIILAASLAAAALLGLSKMRRRREHLVRLVVAAAIVVGLLAGVSSAHALRAGRVGTTTRQCVVPKVKGKGLAAAKKAIKRRGCSVGKIRYAFSISVKKGHVLSQRPGPGTHRKRGARVDLVVSKGPKPLPPHVLMKLSADSPEGTLGAFGSVWVSNHRARRVSRLDPQSGHTIAKIGAGFEVGWPVAGPDAVWTVGDGDGTITRIDPTTNHGSTFQSPFDALCGLSAATASAIWVDVCGDTGFHATFDRIDAATHQVTATVAVGNGVGSMVPVGDTIWAASYDPPQILQFDAVTGTVLKRIDVSGCPLLTPTSYADGYLWVGQLGGDDTEPCTGQPNLLRIDVSTGGVTAVPVGGPAWVATGDGYVWASAPDKKGSHEVITRIDPSSLASTTWTRIPMNEQPDGFAFVNHALWVGWFGDYSIWVVKTQ
jgi:DNA-binding beta-propeller fold protein YncE